MLTSSQKTRLKLLVAVLFVFQAFLQVKFTWFPALNAKMTANAWTKGSPNSWNLSMDELRHQYEPADMNQTGNAVKQLPIEFALGAVVGFREAVAGLLWVRTDEFFHNGDYESITPMIRIITWLDPHQTDVYETGAWHMDYNFTDTDQRSDRRYIPLSIALLKEGIANNPNDPGLSSDLAFTHYFRKIEDYAGAAQYFKGGQDTIVRLMDEADKNPNDPNAKYNANEAGKAITTLSHGLAHAYENMGRIDDAAKQWQFCIDMHKRNIKNGMSTQYGEQSSLQISQRQLSELNLRRKWRQGLEKDPVDAKFDAQLVRIAPKVFIAQGQLHLIQAKNFVLETGARTWEPADGCRVEVRIEDEGYKMKNIPTFTLNSLSLSPDTTILQEACSVNKGGDFHKILNMDKDPGMYSFKAPKYTVTFWFNPSNTNDTPPNVQDRIGWLGEGLTDKRYMDTSGVLPGDILNPVPGLHYIKKTFTLTRDDLLGEGKKVFE